MLSAMSTPNRTDGTMDVVAVMSRIVRLLKRFGQHATPRGEQECGRIRQANVMPSHAPELVSSNTSQAWANFCSRCRRSRPTAH